jgi:hypothetical protein
VSKVRTDTCLKGGVSKDVIISYIDSTVMPYHLTADGIIYLQTVGVPQEITQSAVAEVSMGDLAAATWVVVTEAGAVIGKRQASELRCRPGPLDRAFFWPVASYFRCVCVIESGGPPVEGVKWPRERKRISAARPGCREQSG